MKKFLTILLVALSILPLNARTHYDEVSLTYGQFTVPQFVYVMGGVLGAAFTLGHFTFENTKFLGAAGIEYVHYANNWFGYGGTVTFDYTTSDTYTVSSEGEKTYNGKWNFGYLSVMPELKFSWFNRERVSLYSKIACGPALVLGNGGTLKENISLGAQITPIGVDFGSSSFRGFVETGIGMQGIVNLGLRKYF